MVSLSPVSFFNKVKFNSMNPISFKGISKELPNDTFEKQENLETRRVEDTIEKLQDKISKNYAAVEFNFKEIQKKYDDAQLKLDKARLNLAKELKEKRPHLADVSDAFIEENITGDETSYSLHFSLFDDIHFCSDLFEKYKNAKSCLDAMSIAYKSARKELSDLDKIKYRIKELKQYSEHLKNHPKTAFLYNPDLPLYAKDERVKKMSNLYRLRNLADEMKIQKRVLDDILEKNPDKVIDVYGIIDFDFEPNKKILEDINAFIDKRQRQKVRDKEIIAPLKSRQYYIVGAKTELIPVSYLSKLGFGTMQDFIRELKKGTFKGVVEQKDDKKILKIEVSSDKQDILERMRCHNKNVTTTAELAKMFNLKQSAIRNAIKNDELVIIPEYIFNSDAKSVFINLKDSRNSEFINRAIFERQFEKTLANKKAGQQSLKMKLAWAMCPKTRAIMSDEARNKAWIAPIIAKKEEQGEEALSEKEETQLLSYYKTSWLQAGTDEWTNALMNAQQAINEYNEGGIEAVSNPEAKEYLINILNEDLSKAA